MAKKNSRQDNARDDGKDNGKCSCEKEAGTNTEINTGPRISFEESMQSLEDIVHKLEGGSLTLDESIKMFEEGVRHTNICNEYLKDARMKVEILTKKDSEFRTEDFE